MAARAAAERSGSLRRIGDLIRRDQEALALPESRDTGKRLTQMRSDVDVAARYFGYHANTTEAFVNKDLDVAHTMADEIRAGRVQLNAYGAGSGVEPPCGGFTKSGYGRAKGPRGARRLPPDRDRPLEGTR